MSFAPFFLKQTVLELENPPETIKIWEEGNSSWESAIFDFKVSIISVDIRYTQTFRIEYDLSIPRIVNGSIIYPQDKEDIIVIPFNQENSTILDDFKNYYGLMSFSGVGTLEDYPWDSYHLHFYINGLEEINITKNQEIYLGGSSRNKDWKISRVIGRLSVHKTDGNWLDVWITIHRQPLPIVFSVSIPLLILVGIIAITWITNPLAKYEDESALKTQNNVDIDEEKALRNFRNKEIDNSRKFRVNTVRWLLAFSFGNLFLDYEVPGITIAVTLSLATLILCIFSYLSSNSQGSSSYGAKINFISAIYASGVLLVFFLFLFG